MYKFCENSEDLNVYQSREPIYQEDSDYFLRKQKPECDLSVSLDYFKQ